MMASEFWLSEAQWEPSGRCCPRTSPRRGDRRPPRCSGIFHVLKPAVDGGFDGGLQSLSLPDDARDSPPNAATSRRHACGPLYSRAGLERRQVLARDSDSSSHAVIGALIGKNATLTGRTDFVVLRKHLYFTEAAARLGV